MKRISFIAIAACLMTAFFAGQVFADAFNVTASFGVRVTEKGVSEKVGEITIAPQDVDDDVFTDGQIITVELLGNATLSRTFSASYAFNGGNYVELITDEDTVEAIVPGTTAAPAGADYRVVAVAGKDYFTIEVFTTSLINDGSQIVVGHQEDAMVAPVRDAGQYSALCFNLANTIYNADDPAQQLVQVSYRDSLSNTFSGDIYVATVKPSTIEIANCRKTLDTIELSFTEQDQDCGQDTDSVCIFTFEDPAAGALTGEYSFTVGKTDGAALGIGIISLYLEKSTDGGDTWTDVDGVADAKTSILIDTRWNRSGFEIEEDDFEDDDIYKATDYLYLNSSKVRGSVTLTGTGDNVKYKLSAAVRYDTCTATQGNWVIDVAASRIPCGGSFGVTDWTAAAIVSASGTDQTAVFPYAAGLGAGWYNGISFYNPTSTDLTISCNIKEADGDAYSATIVVPAGQMKVGLVGALLNPTTTGSDAAFGDENYNITATATDLFYGFLFITNGTVAQGYLPIMDPLLETRNAED